MKVNLVFKLLPTAFTAVTMTIEMPAAINAYSIAVAADSSLKNETKFGIKRTPCVADNAVRWCGQHPTGLRVNSGLN